MRFSLFVKGIGVLALTALPVQGVGQSARDDLLKERFRLLDQRGIGASQQSQRALPKSVLRATGYPDVRYQGSYRGPYLDLARSLAERHGVPGDLFARLVEQESNWNPRAISPKGAIGLAQLMPGTARVLGVNPRDPRQNLEGGARYLREQYDTFRDWRLALAAYNAGPEAVHRFGGIPPYRETQSYVVAILGI